MLHMQQPTCTNVRIRSTNDAHKIFHAVQLGILHMVTRRLDADERLALRSGCVYAWEERGPHTEITGLGIERFTEGRRWSPSRVRDEFLFYYEKYTPQEQDSSSERSDKPPADWDPLVKQTYSVWTETDKGRRKWHLTAYFTQGTVDNLGTVDDIRSVGDLTVPEGTFKSTRLNKSRHKNEDRGDSTKESSTSRTYAAFPALYSSGNTSGQDSSNVQPIQMFQPYANYYNNKYQEAGPTEQQNDSVPLSTPQTPNSSHSPSYNPAQYPAPYQAYSHQESRYVPGSAQKESGTPNMLALPQPSNYDYLMSPSTSIPGDRRSNTFPPSSSAPHSSMSSWYNPPYDAHHPQHPNAPGYVPSPVEPATPYPPHTQSSSSTSYHPSTSSRNVSSTVTSYAPGPAYPSSYIADTSIGLYPHSPAPSPGHISAHHHHSFETLPDSQHVVPVPVVPTTIVLDEDLYMDDSCSSPTNSSRSGEIGPVRERDLAPLHALSSRKHPYRRHPQDDKALHDLSRPYHRQDVKVLRPLPRQVSPA
ncbi:hypothetical protein K435DRAFT_797079 [Dendrothele bispora CBS 962.96]|uniref:cAMP-independent regulatory protein pac2 n=1 Tax=Dendrothele bispora (strain CBS 962.96) TaxID=1314807 RepID=A0A4S8M3K7_DENBC|nr:hypothetical protein K435DRAFT_797079 [Dendrothele bispora CBS 962.96]